VDALAICIFQFHSEVLEDFQPLRAVLDVLLQPLRHALPESWGVQVVVTHVCEHHEAVRISPLHHLYRILQPLSRSSAEIHHYPQIDGVHFLDEPVHFFRGGIPMMAVNINERKFGPLDFVFLGNQRGLWLVFLDGRRRLALLRSLLLPGYRRPWPC